MTEQFRQFCGIRITEDLDKNFKFCVPTWGGEFEVAFADNGKVFEISEKEFPPYVQLKWITDVNRHKLLLFYIDPDYKIDFIEGIEEAEIFTEEVIEYLRKINPNL